jgi:hypothetical protein
MRPGRNKLLLIAGVAALAAAIPAISQDTPESILPPGFGDPEPPPKQEERPSTPDEPATPAEPGPDSNQAEAPRPAASEVPAVVDSAQEDLEELPRVRPNYTVDVPAALARPTDVVGVLDPDNWGLGPNAFGPASGAYLATLMRELQAPLPSRWESMLLRRALMSRVPAPASVHPVDWVAARAALLLRMGEADAARALVQSVDVVNYTPAMIQVALDTSLATADPAALCPLIVPGRQLGAQPVWNMADAICAALAGDASRASALIDEARHRGGVAGPDLLLAEKVIGAGTDTRRGGTVRWEDIDRLTPWRFGLAAATGMEIPDRLIDDAGPGMQAWFARAPMVPVEQRLDAAYVAAALGVFSSHALIELNSLIFDVADQADVGDTPAGRLRTAYADGRADERLRALRDLWDDGEGALQRYGRRILTAGAAARIPPSAERADDADDLIAAMLSAGLDAEAARWSTVVAAGNGDELAWALLAVGSARPAVDLSAGSVETFRDSDDSRDDRRSQMLVAALAGLGRIPAGEASQLAADLEFSLGAEDRWTRALDAAAAARQPGTVALLAAVGMQTSDWSRVPPHYLFRIVRALRQVGLEREARMIGAEALMRL